MQSYAKYMKTTTNTLCYFTDNVIYTLKAKKDLNVIIKCNDVVNTTNLHWITEVKEGLKVGEQWIVNSIKTTIEVWDIPGNKNCYNLLGFGLPLMLKLSQTPQ